MNWLEETKNKMNMLIPNFSYLMEIRENREHLLFEQYLNEATLNDIYQKYYNTIPEKDFWEIIKSDPTYNEANPQKMGIYGKWLLNLKRKGLKNEDLYKAKEYLSVFNKVKSKLERKDINQYKSLVDLYDSVKDFINGNQDIRSNSERIKDVKQNGAEKVYEDDEWLVIIPKTEEASCYYGKGTQWCTAATSSNNMFDQYNQRGPLYININKKTGKKYQFHFENDEYRNDDDSYIEDIIANELNFNDNIKQFYASIGKDDDINKNGHTNPDDENDESPIDWCESEGWIAEEYFDQDNKLWFAIHPQNISYEDENYKSYAILPPYNEIECHDYHYNSSYFPVEKCIELFPKEISNYLLKNIRNLTETKVNLNKNKINETPHSTVIGTGFNKDAVNAMDSIINRSRAEKMGRGVGWWNGKQDDETLYRGKDYGKEALKKWYKDRKEKEDELNKIAKEKEEQQREIELQKQEKEDQIRKEKDLKKQELSQQKISNDNTIRLSKEDYSKLNNLCNKNKFKIIVPIDAERIYGNKEGNTAKINKVDVTYAHLFLKSKSLSTFYEVYGFTNISFGLQIIFKVNHMGYDYSNHKSFISRTDKGHYNFAPALFNIVYDYEKSIEDNFNNAYKQAEQFIQSFNNEINNVINKPIKASEYKLLFTLYNNITKYNSRETSLELYNNLQQESKQMNKLIITESQLRNIIKECTRRILLKESFVHQDIFDKEIQTISDSLKQLDLPEEQINIALSKYENNLKSLTFKVGKYKGTPILDCNDMNYLIWYKKNVPINSNEESLMSKIINKEYSLKNYGDYGARFMNNRGIEKKNEILDQIRNGGYSFFCEKNLKSDGTITVDGVRFKFPKFRQLVYNGFKYGLPLKDGQCVKIKNKTITVTGIWEKDNNEEDTIPVKDFIIN